MSKKGVDALFKKNPRSFRIGGDVRPKKRDLSRFVKWPANVRLQRQRKVGRPHRLPNCSAVDSAVDRKAQDCRHRKRSYSRGNQLYRHRKHRQPVIQTTSYTGTPPRSTGNQLPRQPVRHAIQPRARATSYPDNQLDK